MQKAERMDKKTYMQKRYLIRGTKDKLPLLSLSKCEWVLDHTTITIWIMISGKYGLFAYYILPNLHSGIQKAPKETEITYLSCDIICTNLWLMPRNWELLIQVGEDVPYWGSTFLSAIERTGWGTILRMEFSTGDKSSEWKGLFTRNRLRVILERKYYRMLRHGISFNTRIYRFYKCTGWTSGK